MDRVGGGGVMSLEFYLVWHPASGGEERGCRTMAFGPVAAAEWFAENHMAFADYGPEMEAGGVMFHVRRTTSTDVVRVRVKVSLEPTFHGARE